MNFSSIKIFKLLTLILGIFSLFGKTEQQCSQGSQCVLLRSCPDLASLIRTNPDRVRNSICGFERRSSKVCCPSSEETTTKKSATFQLGAQDKESLLPVTCGLPRSDDRIIGGTPAAIGAYPWMVAMGYTAPGSNNPQFICAGTIISSRYVLTAAHCLDPAELGSRKLSVLNLGDWDLSKDIDCQIIKKRIQGEICNPPHLVAGFEETISHPMYNKRGRSSDDIALIRLNKDIDFNSDAHVIQPICLPSKNFDLREYAGDFIPVAAGWGLTEHGNNSNILLRVEVPFANDNLCKARYNRNFVGNQLCVGGTEEGFDTCSGDSGGPLVISSSSRSRWVQIGIVSFGPFPCGLDKFPGVYTAVADYRDWILENIKP